TCNARNVVTLKNSVPRDWTIAVHQAARPGASAARRGAASQLCSAPPAVNRIDPTKNVIASARAPTSVAYNGIGPTRKQVDPSPKAHAIHSSAGGRTRSRSTTTLPLRQTAALASWSTAGETPSAAAGWPGAGGECLTYGRPAAGTDRLGAGVLRGARPERRQHPEGAGRVRNRREPLRHRGRDVRPRARDAHARHHEPGLRRHPHPRRDPVRADHGAGHARHPDA